MVPISPKNMHPMLFSVSKRNTYFRQQSLMTHENLHSAIYDRWIKRLLLPKITLQVTVANPWRDRICTIRETLVRRADGDKLHTSSTRHEIIASSNAPIMWVYTLPQFTPHFPRQNPTHCPKHSSWARRPSLGPRQTLPLPLPPR